MAISLSLTATQNYRNIDSNTSNVTVTVNYSWTYGSYNHSGAWLWITVDGKSNGGQGVKLNPSKTTSGSGTLATFTVDVPHNSDGSKTVYYSATCETGISSGDVTASGSKVLVSIPRAGTLTTAPNFTDEENPKITYSNPAGSSATVETCISLDGPLADIAYRKVDPNATSYTYELTEAERNVLRNACTTANSRSVIFYLKTTIGSNVYKSTLTKTLSIVNANPTISPTIKDTNSKTIALTGDANKLIRYHSNAAIIIGATALKGATLKSQKVINGSKSLTANGTINAIDNNTFKFTATDSRGNTTNKTVVHSTVNYVKLTCNIGGNTPDTQGNFAFTVKGNYFSGDFGATTNTLQVYYRYKSDGDYTEWIAMTPSLLANHTYSAVANLTGLDYRTTYTFQAYAVDKLATVYTEEKPIKASPTFDWSESDFNLNVQLNMKNETVLRVNGDNNNTVLSANNSTDGIFLRPNGTGSAEGQAYLNPEGILNVNGMKFAVNKVLWEGGYYMTASHKINLSEAISKQPHGAVFVFSYFSGSAQNYYFQSFFIPKELINLQSGYGHTFVLAGTNFNPIGTKYMYIGDSTVSGNDNNNATGTTNGITYNNAAFVLRYVIGV